MTLLRDAPGTFAYFGEIYIMKPAINRLPTACSLLRELKKIILIYAK